MRGTDWKTENDPVTRKAVIWRQISEVKDLGNQHY